MKVLIHGATGRMGRVLIEKIGAMQDMEVSAMVSPEFPEAGGNCFLKIEDCDIEADCVIDFSNHASTESLMKYCTAKKLPVVVCTTGQTPEEKEMISEAAKEIPVFFSANMSIGVAVVCDLAKRAAAAFPDADIEIIEIHHNQKLDVPSGTALMVANSIKEARPEAEFIIGRHENGKRRKEDIGIHSLRMGNEVGTHEIRIATGTETLTIRHEAENRSLFADGAIAAAAFIAGKEPGFYNMQLMIG